MKKAYQKPATAVTAIASGRLCDETIGFSPTPAQGGGSGLPGDLPGPHDGDNLDKPSLWD